MTKKSEGPPYDGKPKTESPRDLDYRREAMEAALKSESTSGDAGGNLSEGAAAQTQDSLIEQVTQVNEKITTSREAFQRSALARLEHTRKMKTHDGQDLFPLLEKKAIQERNESNRLREEYEREIPSLVLIRERISALRSDLGSADSSERAVLNSELQNAEKVLQGKISNIFTKGVDASDWEYRDEDFKHDVEQLRKRQAKEDAKKVLDEAEEESPQESPAVVDFKNKPESGADSSNSEADAQSPQEDVRTKSAPEEKQDTSETGEKKGKKKKGKKEDGAGKKRTLEGAAMSMLESPSLAEEAVRKKAGEFVKNVDRSMETLDYGSGEPITTGGRKAWGETLKKTDYEPTFQGAIVDATEAYKESLQLNNDKLGALVDLRRALVGADVTKQADYDKHPKATRASIGKSESQIRLMGTIDESIRSRRAYEYKLKERKEVLDQGGSQSFSEGIELIKAQVAQSRDNASLKRSMTLNKIQHAENFPGGGFGKGLASGGIKTYESVLSAFSAVPLFLGLGLAFLTEQGLTRLNNLGKSWRKSGWSGMKSFFK